MARFRCNTCRGEYRDVLQDDMTYYHACPEGRIAPGGGFVPFSLRRNENVRENQRGSIIAEGRGRVRTDPE